MHRLKRGATDQKSFGRLNVIQRNSAQQGRHSAEAPVPAIRMTDTHDKRAVNYCPRSLGSHSGDAKQVDAFSHFLRLLLGRCAKRRFIKSTILIHQPSPANQLPQHINAPFSNSPMHLRCTIVSFAASLQNLQYSQVPTGPSPHASMHFSSKQFGITCTAFTTTQDNCAEFVSPCSACPHHRCEIARRRWCCRQPPPEETRDSPTRPCTRAHRVAPLHPADNNAYKYCPHLRLSVCVTAGRSDSQRQCNLSSFIIRELKFFEVFFETFEAPLHLS